VAQLLAAVVAVLSAAFGQPPALDGLATHYDHGSVFRSGEPFAPDSPTCAVDVSAWPDLRGRLVFVLTADGRAAVLRVNDSGRLHAAGAFAWGERERQGVRVARWWPDAAGRPVVLDVPRETFRRLSPDLDTVGVWVWVLWPTGGR